MPTLNWAILGTGNIATAFAQGLLTSHTGRLAAVASRSRESADKFGTQFNIATDHCHASYESLLTDPTVEAVYISTPHPLHAEWAIRCADAKKHILCEKPLALNHAQAMAIIEAARASGVFLMEAFMYRCHPQTGRILQLLREGAIGQIRLIHASFSFRSAFNPTHRLSSNDRAGGSILDVGCYPVSFSRLIAGAASNKPFLNPIFDPPGAGVTGHARLHPETGVDEYAVATLRFPNDVLANISCGISLAEENAGTIYGTEGRLLIPTPWTPARNGGDSKILLYCHDSENPEEITTHTDQQIYGIEADTVAAAISAGQHEPTPPAMTWDDTLGNMRTLDLWRQSVGLTYTQEKWGSNSPKPLQRSLASSRFKPIPRATIPGLDKPVSRLVLGIDNLTFPPHVAAMCDDFLSHGGNAFDTAYIYRNGEAERALGSWVQSRNVRDQVVILDKGAHTPECTPESLTLQHRISLDRLQTDYIDLYMLHRDNPAVPVGEFCDALNQHVKAGTMKSIGASNWTLQRVEEFNQYAAAHHLRGFSALSNQFSLARMINPPWPGCLSANDPQSIAYLTRTQLPLFPWSSQSRGFFTADPNDLNIDPEIPRCWHSQDNLERRRRAADLATRKNVHPIHIALTYVLHQPFPTFPLIGPRQLSELHSSLQALTIALTTEDLRWLDLSS